MKRLLMVLFLLTNGCALKGDYVPVAVHDLGPVKLSQPAASGYPVVVRVSAPDWLTDTRLYYRQLFLQPTVLKAYSRDRWIAAPAELLTQRLRLLESTRALYIRVRLIDFEQRFHTENKAESLFSFAIKAFLRKDNRLLGQRLFVYRQENETADATGAIRSFSELSENAADDVGIWLDTLHTKDNDNR